eukprot:CAMPEP_0184975632 /NCGR_PEP_ID=MMETSP1098-20130426/6831_1 /TAXON_ID=89044 /ORGANISM="Spumella elongata, Strain CCAP 955/1" /LENGTH=161 /DNA_ID=CAMNT_0027498395 /DNA_START=8 /DNA_END=493 /DNA_ORIENTATION=+
MASEEISQIVEEFPPPPAYYKLFTNEFLETATAPLVPNGNPYLKVYNGGFAHIQENAVPYKPERDYKADIKSALKVIVDASMKLVSNNHAGSNGFTSVEQNALDLRQKLGDIHELLEEYRVHEARENLITEMTEQLENALSVEDALRKTLAEAQAALDGVL